MRHVDDFLYITNSYQLAVAFTKIITSTKIGVRCPKHRTIINFELPGEESGSHLSEEWIPWCGLEFSSKTLNVRRIYTTFDTNFKHPVNPGQKMLSKLKSFLNGKFHPLLFENTINDEYQCIKNFNELVIEICKRFHNYAQSLELRNELFLQKVISNLLQLAQTAFKKLNSYFDSKQIRWLWFRAFHQLSIKYKNLYPNVKKWCGNKIKVIECKKKESKTMFS